MPDARGYSIFVGLSLTNTSYELTWRDRPRSRKPKRPSPEAFHRSRSVSLGGSETMSTPPTFKNLTAHSAVTAGGPNDRAVTRSKIPSHSGQRAASSARALITSPLGEPVHSRTCARKLLRLTIESRRTPRQRQRSSNTRPGSPPPLPKSRNDSGGELRIASQHDAKPFAWPICGPIG